MTNHTATMKYPDDSWISILNIDPVCYPSKPCLDMERLCTFYVCHNYVYTAVFLGDSLIMMSLRPGNNPR